MSAEDYIYEDYMGDYRIIKSSRLFDFNWYANEYCIDKSEDLVLHFLDIGCKNHFNPNQNFDMEWYLKEYGDLTGNVNPFVHYIKYGKKEGKLPVPYNHDSKYKSDYFTILNSGLFDREWFHNKYSIDNNTDPIYYYLVHGIKQGLNPSPNFDTTWYLKKYPDIVNAKVNPFVHYIKYGRTEGRMPIPYTYNPKYKSDYFTILNSGLFDREWFHNKYSIDNNTDPIYYYLVHGIKQGLNPSPNFDTTWYLKEYLIGNNIKMNPLVHYIKHGQNEGKLNKLYEFNEIPELHLNKTIKGKNNYLFLINDANNELKQHFDKNFKNKFKVNDFIRDYFFKKYLFEKQKINYYYFIVPDKSVLCKDYIPLKWNIFKRNIDNIKFIPDFSKYLDSSCYWKIDSHLNDKGAEILSFHFLNYIDNTFSKQEFQELINECDFEVRKDPSDLLYNINWSYPDADRKNYEITSLEYPIPKDIDSLTIPKEYVSNIRKSEHYYNPYSYSNLKVLIFRDSSTANLKFYFTMYYREVFLYWDHMHLREDLIEWYKPDVVIEIRIERFLDRYITPYYLKQKFMNQD